MDYLEPGVNFVLSCLKSMRGGEIFIPKIPSMKIIDFAQAIGPDCNLEFVGIRPGEKLHEIMITEDDSRYTLELEDRYIITPVLSFWDDKYNLDGKPVQENFTYKSDTNKEWIEGKQILNFLKEIHNS